MPFCIVCMNNENDPDLKDVKSSNAENDMSIIIKLRNCVPEVEWEDDSKICFLCSEQLNYVCSFRKKCVKSYLERKRFFAPDSNEQREQTSDSVTVEQTSDSATVDEVLCISDDDNEEFDLEPEQPSSSSDLTSSLCQYCGENFDDYLIFTNHMNQKHDSAVEDRICEESEDYSLIEVEEEPHSDDDCVIVSVDTVNRKDLIEEKIRNKICYICGQTFENYKTLYNHCSENHCDKLLRCDKCHLKFMTQLRLNRHHSKIHDKDKEKHSKTPPPKRKRVISPPKKIHKCPKCSKNFEFLVNLKIHIANEHRNAPESPHICKFCETTYSSKINLHCHFLTCHPDKLALLLQKEPNLLNM